MASERTGQCALVTLRSGGKTAKINGRDIDLIKLA